eukprot:TRINITY_DN1349_c0_g1_i1.p1 TRINITY_DN1349_c0_g1~~TRINITY_DN1349_c0_g1_i1.p1  ORF type:complete len:944 (-),score=248.58 TRINITY_DN1349_c0_g1_i1:20-2851(-)
MDLEDLSMNCIMAETEKEELEKVINSLKNELESIKKQFKTKEEERKLLLETNNITGNDNEDYLILLEKNTQLENDLILINEQWEDEKNEHAKTFDELEKLFATITNLEDANNILLSEVESKGEEIKSLNETLQDSQYMKDDYEELLDKCLDLEEKNGEYLDTLKEQESLIKTYVELEDNLTTIEKELQADIYNQQIAILEKDQSIENLQQEIDASSETILQLAEMVQNHKDQIEKFTSENRLQSDSLNIQLEIETDLRDTIHSLQSQINKVNRSIIEASLDQLQYNQTEEKLALFMSFIPDSYFEKDSNCVNLRLLMRRIIFKCDIILENIISTFNLSNLVPIKNELKDEESDSPHSEEEIVEVNNLYSEHTYGRKLFHLIYRFWYNSNYFLDSLIHGDMDTYIEIGMKYQEIAPYESCIDDIISKISTGDLNTSYPVSKIEVILERFDHLSRRYLPRDSVSTWKQYHMILENIRFNCHSIKNHIETINASGVSGSASTLELVSEEVLEELESTMRLLEKRTNNKNMIWNDESKQIMDVCGTSSQELLEALQKLNIKIEEEEIQSHVVLGIELKSILITFPNLEGLTSNMENTYDHPFDIYFVAMQSKFEHIIEEIEKGKYENTEEEEEIGLLHGPVVERSNEVREYIKQAGSMKSDLRDLKNRLQDQEEQLTKNREFISELEWEKSKHASKINDLTKALERATEDIAGLNLTIKLNEETAEDKLQGFKDDLREKTLSLKMISEENQELKQELTITLEAYEKHKQKSSNSVANEQYTKEVHLLKKTIDYLSKENQNLKQVASTALLKDIVNDTELYNWKTDYNSHIIHLKNWKKKNIESFSSVVDLSLETPSLQQYIDIQQKKKDIYKEAHNFVRETQNQLRADKNSIDTSFTTFTHEATNNNPIIVGKLYPSNHETSEKSVGRIEISKNTFNRLKYMRGSAL